jgi:hypothetical protein
VAEAGSASGGGRPCGERALAAAANGFAADGVAGELVGSRLRPRACDRGEEKAGAGAPSVRDFCSAESSDARDMMPARRPLLLLPASLPASLLPPPQPAFEVTSSSSPSLPSRRANASQWPSSGLKSAAPPLFLSPPPTPLLEVALLGS